MYPCKQRRESERREKGGDGKERGVEREKGGVNGERERGGKREMGE